MGRGGRTEILEARMGAARNADGRLFWPRPRRPSDERTRATRKLVDGGLARAPCRNLRNAWSVACALTLMQQERSGCTLKCRAGRRVNFGTLTIFTIPKLRKFDWIGRDWKRVIRITSSNQIADFLDGVVLVAYLFLLHIKGGVHTGPKRTAFAFFLSRRSVSIPAS
jgi:hypothetical protein